MATTDNNHGKRATIRGVASAAGVSIATVSRVLNGRPDVAPDTRDAVMRAVREQGFSTNRNARALSGGRTGLIGVTLPLVEAVVLRDHPVGRVRGALRAGHANRALPDAAPARPRGDAARPPDARDDGRSRADAPRGVELGAEGAAAGLPGRRRRSARCARRGDPGRLGGARGRRPRGDRAPALARAPPDRRDHRPARVDRVHGAPERLPRRARSGGVLPDPELLVESDFRNGPATAAAAAKLLDLPDPPTAIFAFNDNVAVGVMRTARERGLRLPEDLSVVGFDDSEQARDRLARSDDRAAAARRDGPDRRQPAAPPAREPARRRASHPARDEARGAGLDRGAASHRLSSSARLRSCKGG